MNDQPLEFPPFVPAKPKGGVEAEIKQSKRKQKAADLAQTGAADAKRRKKRKPRPTTIPLDALPAFAGLSTEEAEQVVTVCEALQTFPKGSRTRIAEAIGKIFI